MNPSQDQINSAIRTLVSTLAGVLMGWAISKGWITQDQATALLPNLITILVAVGGAVGAGVWGLFAHKQANLVATVAAMPEVAKVVTTPTNAGVALTQAVNASTQPPGTVVEVAHA